MTRKRKTISIIFALIGIALVIVWWYLAGFIRQAGHIADYWAMGKFGVLILIDTCIGVLCFFPLLRWLEIWLNNKYPPTDNNSGHTGVYKQ